MRNDVKGMNTGFSVWLLCLGLLTSQTSAQQKIVFIESEEDVIDGCVVMPGPAGKGQVLMGPLVPSGTQAKPDIYSMTYFVDGTNRVRNLLFSFDRPDKFVGYNEVALRDGRTLPNPPFQQLPANGRFGESHLLPLSDATYEKAQQEGMKFKWKTKGKSAGTSFEVPAYFFSGFQKRVEKMLNAGAPKAKVEPSSPYIQTGSIGENKATDKTRSERFPNELSHLKEGELVGQVFIFMPQQPSFQETAYRFGDGLNRKRLPYGQYVGKMVKIITYNTDQDGGEHYGGRVEETGEILTMEASKLGAKLPFLALKRDIDHAREKFIGKKVWLRGHAIYTYNEEKDETELDVKPRFTEFTVKNVVLGMIELPVRFILEEANGETCFLDLHMSRSNTLGENAKLFDFVFYDTNPREIYSDWSDRVFRLVSMSEVELGMTKTQVTVAMGAPDSVTTTEITGIKLEQWHYKNKLVTFNNGACSSIQTLK